MKKKDFEILLSALPVVGLFIGPFGPCMGGGIAYIILLSRGKKSMARNVLYLGVLMTIVLLVMYITLDFTTSVFNRIS